MALGHHMLYFLISVYDSVAFCFGSKHCTSWVQMYHTSSCENREAEMERRRGGSAFGYEMVRASMSAPGNSPAGPDGLVGILGFGLGFLGPLLPALMLLLMRRE